MITIRMRSHHIYYQYAIYITFAKRSEIIQGALMSWITSITVDSLILSLRAATIAHLMSSRISSSLIKALSVRILDHKRILPEASEWHPCRYG